MDTSILSQKLREIFTIVGHSEEEVIQNVDAIQKAAMLAATQRLFLDLPSEQQAAIQKDLTTSAPEAVFDKLLTDQVKEKFARYLGDAVQTLVSKYISSISDTLTQEKRTKLLSVFANEAYNI